MSTVPPALVDLRTRTRRLPFLVMRLAAALALLLAFPGSSSAATVDAFDVRPALLSVGVDGARPTLSTTPAPRLRVDAAAARLLVPEHLDAEWGFLGQPGDERYQLPGGGSPGLPTLGLTAETGSSEAASSLRLTVTGPGDVMAFTGGADGQDIHRIVDTSADAMATVELAEGAVLRPTWIFTEPGSYTVHATASVDGVDGAPVDYEITLVEADGPEEAKPSASVPAPDDEPALPGDGTATPDAVPPARGTEVAQRSAPVAGPRVEPCFATDVTDDAIVVNDGHFDFGVQVAGGALLSRVKDDRTDPPVWRRPASLVFRIDDTAAVKVPANPVFSFLGTEGATVWSIGQSQAPGIPWLGWNTQHASAISGIDGGTRWTLDEVDGPGDLFVYQTGSFGELVRILGTSRTWPKTMTIPANTHAHGNWSFTTPGVYRVTTTHTARLASGATVSSQETLTFLVGPCASAPRKPTAKLPARSLVAGTALVAGNRGGVKVAPTTVRSGDQVRITVPKATEGSWFMPVFYSTPKQTTWKAATAGSTLSSVTVPALTPGLHRVAVYDADGALAGWAPLKVRAESATTKAKTTEAASPGSGQDSAPDVGAPAGGGASSAQPCVARDTRGGDSTGGGTGGSTGRASSVSSGHFDFGAQIVSGRLVPRVKDDRTQPPKWVDPATLTFALGAKAQQKVPAGDAYSFLGRAGSPVWLIPQTQVDGVPWLGWNTQDESVRAQVKGRVNFRLDRVSGPGKLGVYLTDSFGGVGEKKFGTMAGFPSSFDVPVNVHAHGNWAFSAPGTYRVAITQTATLTSGRKVSAPAVLTFSVGGGSATPSSASGVSTESRTVFATAAASPVPLPSAAPRASTEPAPSSAETAAPRATGSNCVLPSAGAPDVSGALFAAVLLVTAGGLLTAAATPARRRSRRI